MSVTTASFMEIVQKCHTGQYKLPAFQRDFKWKRSQVIMLFDSLRQGFPIGSFLILKGEGPIDFSPRPFEFAALDADQKIHEFLVLDGQQRITSGLVLFFENRKEKYFLDINAIKKKLESSRVDLTDRRATERFLDDLEINDRYLVSRPNVKDEHTAFIQRHLIYTPFLADDREFARHARKYLEYHKENSDIIDQIIRPHFIIRRTNDVPQIIVEGKQSVESISRIFATLNTTGQILTPFELVSAVLYPHNIKLSDDIEAAKQQYPYYANMDESGELMLQTVALYAGENTKKALLPRTITSVIYRNWKSKVIEDLNQLGKFLTDRLGAGFDVSDHLLTYPPMFAPMAYVYSRLNESNAGYEEVEHKKRKIEKWFVGALLSRRYQSATHDRQLEDSRLMLEWLDDDNKEPSWIRETRIPRLHKVKPIGSLGKLILCLLNMGEPRDPLTNERIGYRGEAIPSALHHVFPKRFTHRIRGWSPKEEIDLALNLIFVAAKTNSEWLNLDPADQITQCQKMRPSDWRNILGRQYITKDAFSVLEKKGKILDDYRRFIRAREEAVIGRIRHWGFKEDPHVVDEEEYELLEAGD